MWRNVSWNSTEPASLPEGMHKHETGAYFKTPSVQSGASSQSGGGSGTGQLPGAKTAAVLPAPNQSNSTESIEPVGGRSVTPTEELTEEPSMISEPVTASTAAAKVGRQLQQQPVVIEQQSVNSRRARRLRESGPQTSAAANLKSSHNNSNSNNNTNNNSASINNSNRQLSGATGSSSSASATAAATTTTHHPGFRSRLSSISGALQHPKLAKRLFSHHQDSVSEQQHQAPIQITTTSIDSPQHHQAGGHQDGETQSGGGGSGRVGGGAGGWAEQLEPRLMSSSSGRRLSQLFLPQLPNNPMLSQDPYASNELFPPHLLGLYGQPPLVGGSVSPSSAALSAQRASWADISLFGRLSNVRPSIDSAFHSGQVRHSFDARKYIYIYIEFLRKT